MYALLPAMIFSFQGEIATLLLNYTVYFAIEDYKVVDF